MISCGNYDHIEIVCLFQYPVELVMRSGETVRGKALDTQRNQSNEECIKIQSDGADFLVALDSILKLKVLVENPHFKELLFS
ncbi:MAG: Rho-binding antiterminator [Enterovibrio sp.]